MDSLYSPLSALGMHGINYESEKPIAIGIVLNEHPIDRLDPHFKAMNFKGLLHSHDIVSNLPYHS